MPKGTLTPEGRRSRARMGALAALARNGGQAQTAAARANNPSNPDYWLAKVDPAGVLSEADRRQRADAAMRLHFTKLALASAKVRRKKAR